MHIKPVSKMKDNLNQCFRGRVANYWNLIYFPSFSINITLPIFSVSFQCPSKKEVPSHLNSYLFFNCISERYFLFSILSFIKFQYFLPLLSFYSVQTYFGLLTIGKASGNTDFIIVPKERTKKEKYSSNGVVNLTVLSVSGTTCVWERVSQDLPDGCL